MMTYQTLANKSGVLVPQQSATVGDTGKNVSEVAIAHQRFVFSPTIIGVHQNFASFWSLKNRSSRTISSPSRGDSKDIKQTRKHQQTRSFSDWTCEHRQTMRLFQLNSGQLDLVLELTTKLIFLGVALSSELANHLDSVEQTRSKNTGEKQKLTQLEDSIGTQSRDFAAKQWCDLEQKIAWREVCTIDLSMFLNFRAMTSSTNIDPVEQYSLWCQSQWLKFLDIASSIPIFDSIPPWLGYPMSSLVIR